MRHLEPGKLEYRIRIKEGHVSLGWSVLVMGEGGLREEIVS